MDNNQQQQQQQQQQKATRKRRRTTCAKKACANCRQSHVACDDNRPCYRCKQKNIPCVEVDRENKYKIQRVEDFQKSYNKANNNNNTQQQQVKVLNQPAQSLPQQQQIINHQQLLPQKQQFQFTQPPQQYEQQQQQNTVVQPQQHTPQAQQFFLQAPQQAYYNNNAYPQQAIPLQQPSTSSQQQHMINNPQRQTYVQQEEDLSELQLQLQQQQFALNFAQLYDLFTTKHTVNAVLPPGMVATVQPQQQQNQNNFFQPTAAVQPQQPQQLLAQAQQAQQLLQAQQAQQQQLQVQQTTPQIVQRQLTPPQMVSRTASFSALTPSSNPSPPVLQAQTSPLEVSATPKINSSTPPNVNPAAISSTGGFSPGNTTATSSGAAIQVQTPSPSINNNEMILRLKQLESTIANQQRIVANLLEGIDTSSGTQESVSEQQQQQQQQQQKQLSENATISNNNNNNNFEHYKRFLSKDFNPNEREYEDSELPSWFYLTRLCAPTIVVIRDKQMRFIGANQSLYKLMDERFSQASKDVFYSSSLLNTPQIDAFYTLTILNVLRGNKYKHIRCKILWNLSDKKATLMDSTMHFEEDFIWTENRVIDSLQFDDAFELGDFHSKPTFCVQLPSNASYEDVNKCYEEPSKVRFYYMLAHFLKDQFPAVNLSLEEKSLMALGHTNNEDLVAATKKFNDDEQYRSMMMQMQNNNAGSSSSSNSMSGYPLNNGANF